MTSYQFDESKIDPYFGGLSPTQLESVLNHFHSKDLSLPKIIEKYSLSKVANNSFLKLLPPILCPDHLCLDCDKISHQKHLKRGELSNPICPSCKKEMYSQIDPYAILFKDVLLKQSKCRFNKYASIKTITISESEFYKLDLDVQLFLGSLINKGIAVKLNGIIGWMLNSAVLVPNIRYLKHLMTQLGVGTYSPYAINIEIDKDVAIRYFMPYNKLNLVLIQQVKLWKRVALNEVVEIYYGSLEAKGLFTNQHEAIVPIMSDLLNEYSVGQLVNLIWQALNCKYDEYLRGKRDKEHTANSVIYTCKSFGEYKKKCAQRVECFDRPRNYPQSELSKYLFNDVLKIRDAGYKEVPSIEALVPDPNRKTQRNTLTF